MTATSETRPRDPLVRDRVGDGVGRKRFVQKDFAAGEHAARQDREAAHVEEWHAREPAFSRNGAQLERGADRAPEQVRVAELGALRRARGAGGVEHGGGGFELDRIQEHRALEGRGADLSEQRHVAVSDRDALHVPAYRFTRSFGKRTPCMNQQNRLRVVELEADLARRESHVQRQEHRAAERQRVHELHEVETVREQRRDEIARTHAERSGVAPPAHVIVRRALRMTE